MKKILLLSTAVILLVSFKPVLKKLWESKYIKVNADGSLNYIPDAKGNIIPDFSRVGYYQGDKEITTVAVVKTVNANENGDSEELLQSAIDEVAKLPLSKTGFRGAILLKKGTYKIAGTINITKSGIVLRGEGENATKLIATGKGQRSLIVFSGDGNLKEVAGTRVQIQDKFVPVGTFSFTVSDASKFKVGDDIVVYRPGTDEWVKDLQMDKIEARDGTKQWEAAGYNLQFERKITKVEGNKVTIDNPIVMEMEQKYGGAEVFKASFDGRINDVGIENMLIESEYASDVDEDHGWVAVEFNKVQNAWVRNITTRYFGYAAVSIKSTSKQITVKDSKCLDAKSVITGGRRYSFNNDGQLNLFMNLESTDARHDYVTGAKTLGPNVFYNCKATRTHADIGPHHRWAVGTLFDNITTDGEINVQDRGNWGSGHGWAGVTQVLWNCTVKRAAVQSPWAGGQNYSFGTQGGKYEGRLKGRPDGIWEGENEKGINPSSLYVAQLKNRKRNMK
ncbi:hypothetical protein GM921_06505 [Pedobacter sp. LMG 31464]|uniref:Uncharacterized protein n=1 Tax=Pedobacter planticolens TaxID=2679964 RepID=A0A923ITT2_9SPHI|nr:hypothetical protein [Pedobacter planticolens]MBB2145125.1 hypothetical protein [Pedobacter planticolens]